MVLMDKVGRKLLLLWSFIGMVCWHIFLCCYPFFLLFLLSVLMWSILMCIGISNGTSSWCYKFILAAFFGSVFISRWHSCVSLFKNQKFVFNHFCCFK